MLTRGTQVFSSRIDLPLQGSAALVTGAAKRLGRAVAMRLDEESADVAIHCNFSAAVAREAVAQSEMLE